MPVTQALGQRRLVERARGHLLCHLARHDAVDQAGQVAGNSELHPPDPRDSGVARGARVQRRLHDAGHHPLERLSLDTPSRLRPAAAVLSWMGC